MTDMHLETFEQWFSVTQPYTNLRAYGGAKWAVEKKSAAWHGFQAAMRYRDEQEQTSVWRCYKEYMSGDGGRVHSEKFAKTKADMLIFKSQGYDCEKLCDEQEKQA